jgi:hypothetical protein
MIQDNPHIKQEVKDEITIEEGGVYCETGEENKEHDQYQYGVSEWPIKVELAEDFNSQEWKNVYVEKMGNAR